MRSPPLPNHTFRPSPKEAPMRIAINLLDQHGELPMRCQRLIRLPSERRPLPKQPPLSRLAIELEFRDPVIHPSRRIVPYHPPGPRHDIPCAPDGERGPASADRTTARRRLRCASIQFRRTPTVTSIEQRAGTDSTSCQSPATLRITSDETTLCSLARRETLSQSHPLPHRLIRVKCRTNHRLDGFGVGRERIAVRV